MNDKLHRTGRLEDTHVLTFWADNINDGGSDMSSGKNMIQGIAVKRGSWQAPTARSAAGDEQGRRKRWDFVIHADENIYERLKQIQWASPGKFDNCVVCLADFHIIECFARVFGDHVLALVTMRRARNRHSNKMMKQYIIAFEKLNKEKHRKRKSSSGVNASSSVKPGRCQTPRRCVTPVHP